MKKIIAILSVTVMAMLGVVATPDEGSAVPAFARQTGNACSACHFQFFPKLNAYGRAFKMSGFTEASVDLIEDDNMSMPAVMPLSFITKVRYVQTTPKNAPAVKSGTARGEWQIPDEATLYLGGRISKNVGYSMELPGHWGKGAIVFTAPVGDSRVGLSVWAGDGAGGPFHGFDLSNTGVVRSIRGIESRKESIIAQKIGFGVNATGLTLYGGNDLFHAGLSLWGPADVTGSGVPIDTGLDLAIAYRAGVTPTLGGFDTFIGVFGLAGEVKCVECAHGDGSKTETIVTESFGVDAQAQGELGNGMTLEVQAMYISAGGDPVTDKHRLFKKQDGFSAAAYLGFNPVAGLKLAYLAHSDKSGSSNVDTNSTVIGFWYKVAQNVTIHPEYTIYGGDGRSNDNQLLLMLFAGF